MHAVIGPIQYRDLAVAGYDGTPATWGKVYKLLFNAGWRGPVDKNGFPTRRTQEGI